MNDTLMRTTYNRLPASAMRQGTLYLIDVSKDFYCDYYLLQLNDGVFSAVSGWEDGNEHLRLSEVPGEREYQIIKMDASHAEPEETLEGIIGIMLELYEPFMSYQPVPGYEVIDTDEPFDWSHLAQ